MLQTIKKLHALLDPYGRRRTYLMLLLILALAFVEMVGVASIMPVVMILSNPEVVETSRHLNAVYTALGFESTELFMFFLGLAMLAVILPMSDGHTVKRVPYASSHWLWPSGWVYPPPLESWACTAPSSMPGAARPRWKRRATRPSSD